MHMAGAGRGAGAGRAAAGGAAGGGGTADGAGGGAGSGAGAGEYRDWLQRMGSTASTASLADDGPPDAMRFRAQLSECDDADAAAELADALEASVRENTAAVAAAAPTNGAAAAAAEPVETAEVADGSDGGGFVEAAPAKSKHKVGHSAAAMDDHAFLPEPEPELDSAAAVASLSSLSAPAAGARAADRIVAADDRKADAAAGLLVRPPSTTRGPISSPTAAAAAVSAAATGAAVGARDIALAIPVARNADDADTGASQPAHCPPDEFASDVAFAPLPQPPPQLVAAAGPPNSAGTGAGDSLSSVGRLAAGAAQMAALATANAQPGNVGTGSGALSTSVTLPPPPPLSSGSAPAAAAAAGGPQTPVSPPPVTPELRNALRKLELQLSSGGLSGCDTESVCALIAAATVRVDPQVVQRFRNARVDGRLLLELTEAELCPPPLEAGAIDGGADSAELNVPRAQLAHYLYVIELFRALVRRLAPTVNIAPHHSNSSSTSDSSVAPAAPSASSSAQSAASNLAKLSAGASADAAVGVALESAAGGASASASGLTPHEHAEELLQARARASIVALTTGIRLIPAAELKRSALYPQPLGVGSYCDVWAGDWQHARVAVKVFRDHVKHHAVWRAECDVLARLQHPRVVQLIGACAPPPPTSIAGGAISTPKPVTTPTASVGTALLSPLSSSAPDVKVLTAAVTAGGAGTSGLATDSLAIVMAWASHGTVHDVLVTQKRFATDSAADRLAVAQFALDAADALAFVHSERVVHRDVAARNFLVNELGRVCIADFGRARALPPPSGPASPLGTTEASVAALALSPPSATVVAASAAVDANAAGPIKWMAPESLRDGAWNAASDVYMFGVTLWEMFARDTPYANADNLLIAQRVSADGAQLVISESWPAPIRHIISTCLSPDPLQRPHMSDVTRQLGLYHALCKQSAAAAAAAAAAATAGAQFVQSLSGAPAQQQAPRPVMATPLAAAVLEVVTPHQSDVLVALPTPAGAAAAAKSPFSFGAAAAGASAAANDSAAVQPESAVLATYAAAASSAAAIPATEYDRPVSAVSLPPGTANSK